MEPHSIGADVPASLSMIAPPCWHAISEILLPLFQVFINDGDIWTLTACSLVCKAWRRIACLVAKCYAKQLRSKVPSAREIKRLQEPLKHDLKRLRERSFRVLPMPPPFSNDCLEGVQCNGYLGCLLGQGSFSRVYNIGAISSWCIKVASGGLAASDRFTSGSEREEITASLKTELHVPTLEFYYYSSGRATRLLSHRDVSVVLLYEYQRLQGLAKVKLPSWEREPLYPLPYALGVVGRTGYYVMEKLHGITMRKVLLSALRNDNSIPKSETVTLDFAPLISRLVHYMSHLLSEGDYHGDMKPENIMLVADSIQGGYRLRLIDPIPTGDHSHFFDDLLTLPYNPGVFIDWRADFVSVLLLLSEIKTGERPFDRFRGFVCFDISDKMDRDFETMLPRLYRDIVEARWPLQTASLHESVDMGVYSALLQHLTRLGSKLCLTLPRSILPKLLS